VGLGEGGRAPCPIAVDVGTVHSARYTRKRHDPAYGDTQGRPRGPHQSAFHCRANTHDHPHGDPYPDAHDHAHADWYSDAHDHAYADRYPDAYPDAHAHGDPYPDAHDHAHADPYLDAHDHAYTDRYPDAYPDAPPKGPHPVLLC